MTPFDVSAIVLWSLIVGVSILLHWALRRTVSLAALADDLRRPAPRSTLMAGEPAPEFAAPILERDGAAGRIVDSASLRGKEAVLMFVSPDRARAKAYSHLGASIHGLWHKAKGNLYVVCSGDEDACRELASVAVPTHAHGHDHPHEPGHAAHPLPVPVLHDAEGIVAERFLVARTPMAVGLDAHGNVEYTGIQRTPEEVEEIFRESFGNDGPEHTTRETKEEAHVRENA